MQTGVPCNTVLTAADVRRVTRNARAAGLNRQVSGPLVVLLDPDRFSIMSIAVPWNGPDHHLVNAFLAVRGQKDPAELLMDVLAGDWDTLTEASGAEDGVKAALRALTRKWIARMNHPQLSKNPQAQHAYEGCVIDLQEFIREMK